MIDLTGRDQSWWPDFKGQTVAILASGTSLTTKQCDTALDAGWACIAINETWRRAQRAEILYACDWQWWKERAPRPDEWSGLRITGTVAKNSNRPTLPGGMEWQAENLNYMPVRAGFGRLLWGGLELGAGQSSSFQAANLAVRCGARRLVLLGVDCHSENEHWHGKHTHPEASDQKPSLMKTWLKAWGFAAEDFKERGIECINCSPGSAVKCFPRMTVDDAVHA